MEQNLLAHVAQYRTRMSRTRTGKIKVFGTYRGALTGQRPFLKQLLLAFLLLELLAIMFLQPGLGRLIIVCLDVFFEGGQKLRDASDFSGLSFS